MSATLRKREPFCRLCRETGRLEFAKVVDHKVPVADGGPMFDPENVWPLCIACHGRKAEMEIHARQNGLLHMLPVWCDSPDERPAKFKALNERASRPSQ